MRKLATLRKVTEIKPIEGADFIELAVIDGWQCVVKKGDFSVNSVGVYFEIDSFIPLLDARFDFLSNEKRVWNGKEGVRLRTRKFKKQISQGLLLPLYQFPELHGKEVGDDVTEKLKIQKWEPILKGNGFSRQTGRNYKVNPFPWFIPKTDEERVQNIPNVLDMHKSFEFEVTEKLDGTSATFFYGGPDKEFGVCSRNIWLKKVHDRIYMRVWRWLKRKLWNPALETERLNAYWQIAKQYRLDEILPNLVDVKAVFSSNPNDGRKQYALQGEIIGEGIQRNHYGIKGQEFYLFNVYDIKNERYLTPKERSSFLEWLNTTFNVDIKHVPVLTTVILQDHFKSISDIVAYADGKSAISPVLREGVVFKRLDNGHLHFKAVSNKFLLKTGDQEEE